MYKPIHILMQTTIPSTEDDWHVGRFSLLREHLSRLSDESGRPLCEVTARDRKVDADGDDKVLSRLDSTIYDELWLFAVDVGDGLTEADCRGITRFRQRNGGLIATRDHQDLGSSICTLGGVGNAHYFHSRHQDPDEARRERDDHVTHAISWPNYHSGSNGDYQSVTPVGPVHELLRNAASASGRIEYLPAHPHEGGVGAPEGEPNGRVIATGLSQVTHRPFNLTVAFEREVDRQGNTLGRAVAESSFHHFADYNWDTSMGCPSFVTEPPGDQIKREPEKLSHVKAYVANLARWLAGRTPP